MLGLALKAYSDWVISWGAEIGDRPLVPSTKLARWLRRSAIAPEGDHLQQRAQRPHRRTAGAWGEGSCMQANVGGTVGISNLRILPIILLQMSFLLSIAVPRLHGMNDFSSDCGQLD